MSSSEISGKVYAGGLNFSTTTEALKAHFEQYGKVTDCIVMTDRETGRSRGFGFVTFEDPGSANAAIAMPSQNLDGRTVSVKKAVRDAPPGGGGTGMGSSNGGAGAPDNSSSSGEYNAVKIFVGGLSPSVDYDKLIAYFGKFGTIEDAVVMMDASTQRSRGFGFVTFSETSAVEAVMEQYKTNELEGKWVEVKRCVPQDKMAPGQSSKGKGKGGSRGAAPPPMSGGGMMPGGMPDMQSCPAAASYAPGGFPGAYGMYPGAYGGYAQAAAYGAYAGCGYPGAYGAPSPYGYPGYAYPPGYGAAPAYGGCGAPGAFPGYPGMAPAAALPPSGDPNAAQRAAPY